MGIVLSLLCYTVIERLMTKNSTAYAQSTAQKFNVEVKYLFDRADALFSSLLFNENIEQIMHTPFSAKTPSYLNALHTQFSSYRLMNAELAEIALVTPEMSWSSYFDAATLRAFSEEMRNLRGMLRTAAIPSYGTCRQPGTAVGFWPQCLWYVRRFFVWSVFRQYHFITGSLQVLDPTALV